MISVICFGLRSFRIVRFDSVLAGAAAAVLELMLGFGLEFGLGDDEAAVAVEDEVGEERRSV